MVGGKIQRGIGFPSSSRELALTPINRNDANGYYSTLLLPPHASFKQIKEAYRSLARTYHPDGSHPDPQKFRTITEIYKVLSDPETKRKYDSVEEGSVFIGELEIEELRENLRKDVFDQLDLEELGEGPLAPTSSKYTFYGDLDEWEKGQEWYEFLLMACYLRSIETTLRVGVGDVPEKTLCRTFMGRTTYYFDSSLTPSLESALEVLEIRFPSL